MGVRIADEPVYAEDKDLFKIDGLIGCVGIGLHLTG
jgi:hypothetical protein